MLAREWPALLSSAGWNHQHRFHRAAVQLLSVAAELKWVNPRSIPAQTYTVRHGCSLGGNHGQDHVCPAVHGLRRLVWWLSAVPAAALRHLNPVCPSPIQCMPAALPVPQASCRRRNTLLHPTLASDPSLRCPQHAAAHRGMDADCHAAGRTLLNQLTDEYNCIQLSIQPEPRKGANHAQRFSGLKGQPTLQHRSLARAASRGGACCRGRIWCRRRCRRLAAARLI